MRPGILIMAPWGVSPSRLAIAPRLFVRQLRAGRAVGHSRERLDGGVGPAR